MDKQLNMNFEAENDEDTDNLFPQNHKLGIYTEARELQEKQMMNERKRSMKSVINSSVLEKQVLLYPPQIQYSTHNRKRTSHTFHCRE